MTGGVEQLAAAPGDAEKVGPDWHTAVEAVAGHNAVLAAVYTEAAETAEGIGLMVLAGDSRDIAGRRHPAEERIRTLHLVIYEPT